MEPRKAAVFGGLIAGVVTTAVMFAGRKSGLLTRTLDRDAVDWMDRTANTRAAIGDSGTSLLEFGNHLGASAIFGLGYAYVREVAPKVPGPLLGAGYGTVLYAVNIAGIAPVLGITEGERRAGLRKAVERWGLHVLQAVVTAVVAESCTSRIGRRGWRSDASRRT